jgi:TonB family protein
MSHDFRFRPDSPPERPSGDEKNLDAASSSSGGPAPDGRKKNEPIRNVAQVAQALAAKGGGALSVDLAFDLVLNDLVEQAREATGANGAAIALVRDGYLVCRATAGDNAPDLGVRVETASGLAGACLRSATLQDCRDTESDPRVNAEACRRLGVRSMLIAPLIDRGQVFGILQVFSAWPNVFAEREGRSLESLAETIVQNKRQAELGPAVLPAPVEMDPSDGSLSTNLITAHRPSTGFGDPDRNFALAPTLAPVEERPRSAELWTTLLIVLVIGTAVMLGIAIGWHSAATGIGGSAADRSAAAPSTVSANSNPTSSSVSPNPSQPANDVARDSSLSSAEKIAFPASPSLPTGGLLVTQDGRVIYRSAPGSAAANSPPGAAADSGARLLRRVNPDYPPEAKDQNIQGTVVLVVEILADGSIGEVGVASGDPLLAKAAVKAVRQWRYQPYSVHGQPIERQTRISVKFTLAPG